MIKENTVIKCVIAAAVVFILCLNSASQAVLVDVSNSEPCATPTCEYFLEVFTNNSCYSETDDLKISIFIH